MTAYSCGKTCSCIFMLKFKERSEADEMYHKIRATDSVVPDCYNTVYEKAERRRK